MNDKEYLEIMAQLKFIGSVKEGQFLNRTTGKIEQKNYYTRLVRGLVYRQENGQTCAFYCQDVVARALKLLDKYKGIQGEDEFVTLIKQYISEAKVGIAHLRDTHEENNLAFAAFDSIIVRINQRLK